MIHNPTTFQFMMKNLFCLVVFFSPGLALAGMVAFKDGNGQIYQIDTGYNAKNGVRTTRIRWPDNAVDVIEVDGCSRGSGELTRYDKNQRKKFETLSWSSSGVYLIDRVAREVCKL